MDRRVLTLDQDPTHVHVAIPADAALFAGIARLPDNRIEAGISHRLGRPIKAVYLTDLGVNHQPGECGDSWNGHQPLNSLDSVGTLFDPTLQVVDLASELVDGRQPLVEQQVGRFIAIEVNYMIIERLYSDKEVKLVLQNLFC